MEKQRLSNKEYSKLPKEPGVYKFISSEGSIIYVGKAKNLVKRVSSYFTKTNDTNRKTIKLVSEISEIEFTIVNSEFDALLLENNLIKENKPKYNILLKDDKSFPSICVTNERFPRIFSTRNIDLKKGQYFGPYTSVKAMNGVLQLIQKLHKVRTCSLNLSPKNIRENKFKVCLEYHIGNCLGPCEGLQKEDHYQEEIARSKEILSGKVSKVLSEYKKLMLEAASKMQFETADELKTKIEMLDRFQTKSLIVNPKIESVDVLGVIKDEENIYFNYMSIIDGAIKVSETLDVTNNLGVPDNEFLQGILFTLRTKFKSIASELLSNIDILVWDNLNLTIPQIGDKKKLLDLSLKNALYYKNEKLTQKEEAKNEPKYVIKRLQEDLNLKQPPYHIECFDNSNIQGTNPVASMVCFKNAKPSKKDYRKFNIKTVEGPDDFLSMKEVVGRRYLRLKNENQKLPNLVVVDGGKGQLSSACEALKEIGLYGQIPIIGIAKRLEEIYYPEDSFPIHISKKSPSLKILQHLRDEAHRFAITFHRSKRSKGQTKSELDNISGIGPSARNKLISSFKSLKRVKEASLEELIAIVGEKKAIALRQYFEQKKEG
ncbi:MAG: excinuclease ABC subunit UvrC [Cyclobacteriaceae bacterium]